MTILLLEDNLIFDEIRTNIKNCEIRNHTQQVSFSTYFMSLVQVCFDCKKVRKGLVESE